MATLKKELREILDQYGISPTDKAQIWDCHGTLVLYHKAYEIIAAKEAIRFDPPTIIEGSSEKKTVAILVVGHMGDRSEWSIGEAAPGNNKNSYPYAMAEKRAKDRVVAKLVGLAAYVYSEDEADDFKHGDRQPVQVDDAPPKTAATATKAPPAKPHAIRVPATANGSDWRAWGIAYTDALRTAANVDQVYAWIDTNADALANCGRDNEKLGARIKEITREVLAALEGQMPDNRSAAA